LQKLFFIIIGIIFLNTAQAQKYCMPGGYAFNILIQPGTIPVDDKGVPLKRQINKERFIYLITPGKDKPTLTSIVYGKTAVKWDLPGTAENEFSAVTENTQKTMNIKPPKGCSMWRINIQEINNQRISENIPAINVTGKIDNKSFTLLIFKETAVQGFDTY
jgi:hypothetical protein